MNADRLEQIKGDLKQELGDSVITFSSGPQGLMCEVRLPRFADVAATICHKHEATMLSLHAVDDRASLGAFSLYCLLFLRSEGTVLTLATKATDSFPSLTPSIYCANWYEREIQDMFGLRAIGHPDPRPLVLYDSWPKGLYPLRKDFDPRAQVPRVPSPYEFKKVEGDGVFEVPVGPVHAGVIEPGHFRFSIAGEPILHLEVRMGYVHRGVEKSLEGCPLPRALRLVERISGDSGVAHSLAFCQAVEMGTEVPERAKLLRCVYAEMERIYNHLGDIGGMATDVAFVVPAAECATLRERMLQLNMELTGHRLLWGTMVPGGVAKDIDAQGSNTLERAMIELGLALDPIVGTLNGSPSFMDRVETTGVLTLQAAKDLGATGPVARASGLGHDARRDLPYAAYPRLGFLVPVHREGDVLARLKVKVEEVRESISLVNQCLGHMREGELRVDLQAPHGFGLGLVEAPRGELVHCVHFQEGRIVRYKVRDPSFCNWPTLEKAVLGDIVPDFPLINKSYNLSYAGNDL